MCMWVYVYVDCRLSIVNVDSSWWWWWCCVKKEKKKELGKSRVGAGWKNVEGVLLLYNQYPKKSIGWRKIKHNTKIANCLHHLLPITRKKRKQHTHTSTRTRKKKKKKEKIDLSLLFPVFRYSKKNSWKQEK